MNPGNLEIHQEIKNENDIFKIVKALTHNPNMAPYSFSEIKKEIEENKFFLAYQNNELVGFSSIEQINSEWTDFSRLFVFEPFRDRKYGYLLAQETFKAIKTKKIVTCSRNPLVKEGIIKLGFRPCYFLELPLKLRLYYIKYQFNSWPRFLDFLGKIFRPGWRFFIREKG